MTQELWRCGPFDFDLRDEPVIMGILNVTPDSFSDGGEHNALPDALAWAEKMRGDGARITLIASDAEGSSMWGANPPVRARRRCRSKRSAHG